MRPTNLTDDTSLRIESKVSEDLDASTVSTDYVYSPCDLSTLAGQAAFIRQQATHFLTRHCLSFTESDPPTPTAVMDARKKILEEARGARDPIEQSFILAACKIAMCIETIEILAATKSISDENIVAMFSIVKVICENENKKGPGFLPLVTEFLVHNDPGKNCIFSWVAADTVWDILSDLQESEIAPSFSENDPSPEQSKFVFAVKANGEVNTSRLVSPRNKIFTAKMVETVPSIDSGGVGPARKIRPEFQNLQTEPADAQVLLSYIKEEVVTFLARTCAEYFDVGSASAPTQVKLQLKKIVDGANGLVVMGEEGLFLRKRILAACKIAMCVEVFEEKYTEISDTDRLALCSLVTVMCKNESVDRNCFLTNVAFIFHHLKGLDVPFFSSRVAEMVWETLLEVQETAAIAGGWREIPGDEEELFKGKRSTMPPKEVDGTVYAFDTNETSDATREVLAPHSFTPEMLKEGKRKMISSEVCSCTILRPEFRELKTKEKEEIILTSTKFFKEPKGILKPRVSSVDKKTDGKKVWFAPSETKVSRLAPSGVPSDAHEETDELKSALASSSQRGGVEDSEGESGDGRSSTPSDTMFETPVPVQGAFWRK